MGRRVVSGEEEGEVWVEVNGGGLEVGVLECPLRRVGAEDDMFVVGVAFSDGRARGLRSGSW